MVTTKEISPHAIVNNINEWHEQKEQENYYLNLALFYGSKKFKVFPVRPDKYPYKNFSWTKRASSNPDEIKAMWQEYPNGRPAFYCKGSGIVVIDTDNKPEKKKYGFKLLTNLVSELGVLPKTILIYTQSNGTHMYFKIPPNVQLRRKIGNCIDIQTNAYCVCGGVKGNKGYYRFAKGFTFEDINEIPQLPKKWIKYLTGNKVNIKNYSITDKDSEPIQIEGHFQKLYEQCVFCRYAVDNADSLEEIYWFYFANILSKLKNGFDIFDYFSKPYPNYSYKETRAKFDNARKYKINCKTIARDFKECKKCQYNKK